MITSADPSDPSWPADLTRSAVFVVMPKGGAATLTLQAPSSVSAGRPGGVCPVVLQLQMPAATTNLEKQAHVIPAGTPTDLTLFAYNFSDAKVSGTIGVKTPANGEITPTSWAVVLDPMERKALPAAHRSPVHGRRRLGQIEGRLRSGGPIRAGVSPRGRSITREGQTRNKTVIWEGHSGRVGCASPVNDH